MRGSIVRRGRSYALVLDLDRDPSTGRRRQKWHSGYRTKREAAAALAELVTSVNRGVYVPTSRQTVAEYVDEWLAAIAPTVRPSTHYSYTRNLRLHLLPYLGTTPLTAVDAGALNALYARLLVEGRRNQAGGGLSARSVSYVHSIAHRAFKDAVKWGRLVRNPADAADPPRATASGSPDMVTWTAAELHRFLDGVRDDRLHAAYFLLATTGMRRGEALGLRWTDVDLDAGRAAVRQTVIAVNHQPMMGTPKTAKGRRNVSLDARTVTALRDHRVRQAAERLQMGSGWTDHGLVFCRVDGAMLHPERFSRSFGDRVRQLGLPPIRLHDLRHGWATMALAGKVNARVVQERLGHANVGITLNVYSHVTDSMQDDAAETVADIVFSDR